MAAPKRIDDHSSWMGAKGKDTVFPSGPYKTKDESSADCAGHLGMYEDTTEAIRSQQEMGTQKVKGRLLKTGYRN